MPVVQHAGLNDRSRFMQINKTIRDEENQTQRRFSRSEHKGENSVASLACAHVDKSIMYVTTKCTHKQITSQQNTLNTAS